MANEYEEAAKLVAKLMEAIRPLRDDPQQLAILGKLFEVLSKMPPLPSPRKPDKVVDIASGRKPS
jgi:hypothetical protein